MKPSHTNARSLLRQLASERILVLDGAMGTMIQEMKLDEQGYRGAKDLLAYEVDVPYKKSPILERLLARNAEHIKVRPFDRSRRKQELATLREIFNDAWSQNWSFVPLTEAVMMTLPRLRPTRMTTIPTTTTPCVRPSASAARPKSPAATNLNRMSIPALQP